MAHDVRNCDDIAMNYISSMIYGELTPFKLDQILAK